MGEFEILNDPNCGDETQVTQAAEVELANVLKPGDQFVMNDMLFTIESVRGVGSFSGVAVAESQLSFANIGGSGASSLRVEFNDLLIDKNCRVRGGSILQGSGDVLVDDLTLTPYLIEPWTGEIDLACEAVNQNLEEDSSKVKQIEDDAHLKGNDEHEEGSPAGDRVDPNVRDSITDPNNRDTTITSPTDTITTVPVEGTCNMELTLIGNDRSLCPGDEPLDISIQITNPNPDSTIVSWSGPAFTVDEDDRLSGTISAPGAYSVTVTLHGKPQCSVSQSFTVQAGDDCDKSEPLALFYDGETYQGCSAEEMASRRAAAKDLAARSESFSRSATADPSAAESSSLSSSAEDACEINIEVECKNNYLFEIKNLEDGETVNWSYDLGEEGNFEVTTAVDHIIIKRLEGGFKSGAWIKATSADRPDEVMQVNLGKAQIQVNDLEIKIYSQENSNGSICYNESLTFEVTNVDQGLKLQCANLSVRWTIGGQVYTGEKVSFSPNHFGTGSYQVKVELLDVNTVLKDHQETLPLYECFDPSTMNISNSGAHAIIQEEADILHVYNDYKGGGSDFCKEHYDASVNIKSGHHTNAIWPSNACKVQVHYGKIQNKSGYGNPTISVGILIANEADLVSYCSNNGGQITQAQSTNLFRTQKLPSYVNETKALFGLTGAKITQCQLDAMVSYLWNRGGPNVRNKSDIYNIYIAQGNYHGCNSKERAAMKGAIVNDGTSLAGGPRRNNEANLYMNCAY